MKRQLIQALVVGVLFLGLTACSTDPQVGGNSIHQRSYGMAEQTDASLNNKPQIETPADVQTATVKDEAMLTIQAVLTNHQCINAPRTLRRLNIFTVPGNDMDKLDIYINDVGLGYPNTSAYMKYHDHDKCVRVTALDQWTQPALNALQFRAVYFADDSGETVNFRYLFRKADDGTWKLADFKARVE